MNTFNIQQCLVDTKWEVIPGKVSRFENKYNFYTKVVEADDRKYAYEFEIHGESTYRPNAYFCKIVEKGFHNVYYVLFDGTISSKEELKTIMICVGIDHV